MARAQAKLAFDCSICRESLEIVAFKEIKSFALINLLEEQRSSVAPSSSEQSTCDTTQISTAESQVQSEFAGEVTLQPRQSRRQRNPLGGPTDLSTCSVTGELRATYCQSCAHLRCASCTCCGQPDSTLRLGPDDLVVLRQASTLALDRKKVDFDTANMQQSNNYDAARQEQVQLMRASLQPDLELIRDAGNVTKSELDRVKQTL